MIWITGAGGMLGRHMERACTNRGLDFVSTGREVDISSMHLLKAFLAGFGDSGNPGGHKIDQILNCAAWTDVKAAESSRKACMGANAAGPQNLAVLCRAHGMRLVHFSTDQVFTKAALLGKALVETDLPEPANYYAESKRAGEQAILASGCEYLVLRTSWLYGKGGRNVVDVFAQSMLQGRELTLVTDQYSVPTWCGELAEWTLDLMEKTREPCRSGIFHAVSRGCASAWELALEIRSLLGSMGHQVPRECLRPVPAQDYPDQVKRPSWSVLDPACLEEILGRPQPDWKTGLARYLESTRGRPDQGGKPA